MFKHKEKILKAKDKGIKAALALNQLQNLRLGVKKRLFYSKLTPVTDYTFLIWASVATKATLKKLRRVHQMKTQVIKKVLIMLSFYIAELKAFLLSIQTRFCHQELNK